MCVVFGNDRYIINVCVGVRSFFVFCLVVRREVLGRSVYTLLFELDVCACVCDVRSPPGARVVCVCVYWQQFELGYDVCGCEVSTHEFTYSCRRCFCVRRIIRPNIVRSDASLESN